MIVLKENETYLVLDDQGAAAEGMLGVYRNDTRQLSRWVWRIEGARPLVAHGETQTLRQYAALTSGQRVQTVGIERRLNVSSDGFEDVWTFTNTSRAEQSADVRLDMEGEFRDLFALWAGSSADGDLTVTRSDDGGAVRLSRKTSDGVEVTAEMVPSTTGPVVSSGPLAWRVDLPSAGVATLGVTVRFSESPSTNASGPLPSYAAWREGFDLQSDQSDRRRTIERSIDDLRMLLLGTEHGPYPAAGLPWFSNIFGRDAILTAQMLLAWRPELALAVLKRLAADQGRTVDPFREEEPGKIPHEIRRGELSRLGRAPFGRYYGSVDSTALYVTLLDAYLRQTGDEAQLAQLRGAWEPAVRWLADKQGKNGELITFAPSGSGLTVQSWKDSSDSMNHADGSPAEAPLAVAEVQGYAYAAFRAAADFYRRLDAEALAAEFDQRAARLAADFHARFWLEELQTYAMALDRHGAPLAVLSSDPGHLLWSGIVPEAQAPALAKTLLGPELWSGWGLRTLGSGEKAYNPVSYHNGSVWPHDTALFAAGLARYGFMAEARMVSEALFDLAAAHPLNRLPEVISGFAREPGIPPVPYTHACWPQAWAAAGLLYAARQSGTA